MDSRAFLSPILQTPRTHLCPVWGGIWQLCMDVVWDASLLQHRQCCCNIVDANIREVAACSTAPCFTQIAESVSLLTTECGQMPVHMSSTSEQALSGPGAGTGNRRWWHLKAT